MDFDLTDEQAAICDVASQILGDQVTHEQLRDLERTGDTGWITAVWRRLADADLLGVGIPAEAGGTGLGILEACLVAEQIGRAGAPLPFVESIAGAAIAIARFGTPQQLERWLPGAVDGSTLLTVALAEGGNHLAPTSPATVADPMVGGGYELNGEKHFVAFADRADRVLVPASVPGGRVVCALVDPTAEGITREDLVTTHGVSEANLAFDGVVITAEDVLGGDDLDGTEALAWTIDRSVVATCAMQAGVCGAALDLTASYTAGREQFGVPIATFQAVAHRAADAFIDLLAVRCTMLQAAWRLDQGLDATDELHIAKFWAAEGAQRVVHACQHLHGGIGVDIDYPLHRYFRWAKKLELTLGGASPHLAALGASL